jgi:hypothetical protein
MRADHPVLIARIDTLARCLVRLREVLEELDAAIAAFPEKDRPKVHISISFDDDAVDQ